MASSREIVCREFKNREKLFLNYESQKKISLGDIFVWSGWDSEFSIVSRLEAMGVKYRVQPSNVKSTRLFQSGGGVRTQFSASGKSGTPSMEFKYKGASRYSLQAFDTKVESLDEVDLAENITIAIRDNGLSWDKDWIVVTTVWSADSYTQLVAGAKDAEAHICATAGSVTGAFNIADTSLGVNLGYSIDLCSQEVASAGANPFFVGMKYRQQKDRLPHMVRYGVR